MSPLLLNCYYIIYIYKYLLLQILYLKLKMDKKIFNHKDICKWVGLLHIKFILRRIRSNGKIILKFNS